VRRTLKHIELNNRFGLGSLGAHVGSLKTTHDQEFIHFFICEKLAVIKTSLLLFFFLGRKQQQPQQYTHSQIQHAIYNLDRSKAKKH
jgi:uncharacterized membrane protein YsdA (DUF1294 family)